MRELAYAGARPLFAGFLPTLHMNKLLLLAGVLLATNAQAVDYAAYQRQRANTEHYSRMEDAARRDMLDQAQRGIADRAARRDERYRAFQQAVREEDAQRQRGVVITAGPRSTATLLSEFRAMAEGGNAQAMRLMGQAAMSGSGMPVDRAAAVQWFARAAQAGDVESQAIYGTMLAYGFERLKADPPASVRFLRAAAEAGDAAAAARMGFAALRGHGLAESEAQAVQWFQRAAQGGSAEGKLGYGDALMFGKGGAAKDEVQGLRLLREAAAAGLSDAQLLVGGLAANGRVPGMAREEGARLVRGAAEAGHTAAQRIYASLIFEGNGTPRDLADAQRWFERAAKAGDAASQWQLCASFLNGQLGRKDASTSRSWCAQAAAQGHPDAVLAHAEHLAGQHGGSVDLPAARRLLAQAADGGDSRARKRLQDLEGQTPAPVGTAAPAAQMASAVAPATTGPGPGASTWTVDLSRDIPSQVHLAVGEVYGHGPELRQRGMAALAELAKSNHPLALFEHGNLLTGRFGFMKADGQRARDVLARAAEAGNMDALGRLGELWAKGVGGPKDVDKGRAMLDRAIEGESGLAMYERAIFHLRGEVYGKDLVQSDVLARRSAESGYAEGMWLMGIKYQFGSDTQPADGVQAVNWYRKAMAQHKRQPGAFLQMALLLDPYERGVFLPNLTKMWDDAEPFYRQAAGLGVHLAAENLQRPAKVTAIVAADRARREQGGGATSQAVADDRGPHFVAAVGAARELGFNLSSMNEAARTASFQRQHEGQTVRLELEVRSRGFVSANVIVMDDNTRTAFIRAYRQRLQGAIGGVRIEGNVNWQ